MFEHHVNAEHRLAACAAETVDGAQLAAGRVQPGDFYDARAARVLKAAAASPRLSHAERLHHIAEKADVPPAWLAHICRLPRLNLADRKGHYANVVREQAQQRRQAHEAHKLLEHITGRQWSAAA